MIQKLMKVILLLEILKLDVTQPIPLMTCTMKDPGELQSTGFTRYSSQICSSFLFPNIGLRAKTCFQHQMIDRTSGRYLNLIGQKSYPEYAKPQSRGQPVLQKYISSHPRLWSISPTFYKLTLHAQITIVQKDSQIKHNFCAFGIWACKSCA